MSVLRVWSQFAHGCCAKPVAALPARSDHSREIDWAELKDELDKLPEQHANHRLEDDMVDDLMREADGANADPRRCHCKTRLATATDLSIEIAVSRRHALHVVVQWTTTAQSRLTNG